MAKLQSSIRGQGSSILPGDSQPAESQPPETEEAQAGTPQPEVNPLDLVLDVDDFLEEEEPRPPSPPWQLTQRRSRTGCTMPG